MDKSQLEDVLQQIETVKSIDIPKVLSEVFGTQALESITIGQYTCDEYVSTLNRLLKQFLSELEINGLFLPWQYNLGNEYGGGQLSSNLKDIYLDINKKTHAGLNESARTLNQLISYQIVYGFWDKSTKKLHDPSELNIHALTDELQIKINFLNDSILQFNHEKGNIARERENLAKFIEQKNQELSQITANLNTSNSLTNQINQLHVQNATTTEKITGLLGQQTQNLEEQRAKSSVQDAYFSSQKELFDELTKSLKTKDKTIEEQIAKFTSQLEFVEDKRSFFEERNNYLNELIGREVGASLFETFKQRKGELGKPVRNWLWIVIGMAVLSFVAILAMFTNGFTLWGKIPDEFTATLIITNSIKTIPFFFLLFYSISQYNKERNFQEEYSFKSAVALTIKAYADLIKDDSLKDNLIINSVNSVYKSPTISKTRNSKEDIAILDTAKELLSTVVDVVKKK